MVYIYLHFQAPSNNALSAFTFWSISINLAPTNNYITIPAVTVGDIPNSIIVPLFDANITLNQQKGSDEEFETTPYKGI